MKHINKNYIHMSGEKTGSGDPGVAIEERQKLQKPKMYKVLMHNDDYSPMEFVVHILQRFFHKNAGEAQTIMLKIHHDGVGLCGIFTCEVAESKVNKVNRYSRSKEHPLKCSFEPCDSED